MGHRARPWTRTSALALSAALLLVVAAAAPPSVGAQAAKPRRGGTVLIPLPNEPTCLNGLVPACAFTPAHEVIINQVLEGAFELGPDLTFRPNLVSRAAVKKRPFTVTYHIRPEARWSDGTPVTARDFVFTFHVHVDQRNETLLADLYRTIRRIRAVDEKTVRVIFRNPTSDWRDLFHEVLPRHALTGEDFLSVWRDGVVNPKTGSPIGSGPFLVHRFDRGGELTLARNPRYWGAHKAYLDRIVFRFVSADFAVQVAALRAGRVDVISPQAQPEVAGLRRELERGLTFASIPSLTWENLTIRLGAGGHPALKNRLVRRALAYALDREALVRRLFREIDSSLAPLQSGLFQENTKFYRPNWQTYRHRPQEARRLLSAAGCRRGSDGIYACAGRRLSLRLVTTAGNERRKLTADFVQAQLGAIGVEVVPMFASPRVFFSILPGGDFDLALFAYIGFPEPFTSAYFCGHEENTSGYCSRRISRDLARSQRILDSSARYALINRVDEQLARDVPLIPLYQVPTVAAYKSALRNVVLNPTIEQLTWNSEDWWLSR